MSQKTCLCCLEDFANDSQAELMKLVFKAQSVIGIGRLWSWEFAIEGFRSCASGRRSLILGSEI